MTDWSKANKLKDERDNKLIELMQTPGEDDKNAIRAEIKNIDIQLEKILGKKEFSRLEEIKNKNGRKEKIAIDNYYEFKNKVALINPFNTATKRMLITTTKIIENNVLRKVA